MRRTIVNRSELLERNDAGRRKKSSGGGDSVSSKTASIARFYSTDNSIGDEKRLGRRKTLATASLAEVPVVRAQFESDLPKLDQGRVRRFRIPHHEAVILELEEDGLREAADYVRGFLELDDKIAREEAATGSGDTSKKPRLKSDKSTLQHLVDGLRSAEIAERMGNVAQRASALTQTAVYFEAKSREYYWIAERLFGNCLAMGTRLREEQPQIFTAVKYIYGRFLFEKMKNAEGALTQLNSVRTVSKGKRWKMPEVFGFLRGTLYDEACVLSHRALLFLSRSVRSENPELAVRAAEEALDRATDCVDDKGTALALYELGKSQSAAGRLKEALRCFSKLLAIARRIPDAELVCDAHMELAFAHKELEDSEGSMKHLESLRRCATRYDLPYKLAQAHYYTGEHLLNKGQPDSARCHLELALQEFRSLGKNAEAERARCAAAISKGQEVMASYVDLIANCHRGDSEAIIKLCDWKITRIPFSRLPTTEDSSDVEETKFQNPSLRSLEQ